MKHAFKKKEKGFSTNLGEVINPSGILIFDYFWLTMFPSQYRMFPPEMPLSNQKESGNLTNVKMWLIIYLYYNGTHTTAAVFPIHSAPPCCSTVCYWTLYRHIDSGLQFGHSPSRYGGRYSCVPALMLCLES